MVCSCATVVQRRRSTNFCMASCMTRRVVFRCREVVASAPYGLPMGHFVRADTSKRKIATMRVYLRFVARWVLPFAAGGALLAYLLLRHDGNANALPYAATYGVAFALSGALFHLHKLREQN